MSSNACRFVFVLAAACNAVTSAKENHVELLTAGDYVILTKSGISTIPDSVITGDIAVSPIAGEAMTGFSMAFDSSGEFATSTQVVGRAFAANYNPPIPTHLTSAVSAMETAYTDAASRVNPDAARINLGGGTLGGVFGGATDKLTPGVYTFGSDVSITSTIYFDGTGYGDDEGATDVFIIQMTGNLMVAANYDVVLTNGARAQNIFWQIAGNVKVGAGAHMEGILLVKTDVMFETGSSLNGRVLAQTACNLQMATITQPTTGQGLGEGSQATAAAPTAATKDSACGIACGSLAGILIAAVVIFSVVAVIFMKQKNASKAKPANADGEVEAVPLPAMEV